MSADLSRSIPRYRLPPWNIEQIGVRAAADDASSDGSVRSIEGLNRGLVTACGHARDDHADARQHDRQCRAAAYARQLLGGAGRDHLGADLLHRRGRDRRRRSPAGSPAHFGRKRLFSARSSASPSPRCCAGSPAASVQIVIFPPAAGRFRRGAGAAVADDAAQHLSARESRRGDGDLGRGRDARRRSSARRSAAGSPTLITGAGSSTSTCRSASLLSSRWRAFAQRERRPIAAASISSASPCSASASARCN